MPLLLDDLIAAEAAVLERVAVRAAFEERDLRTAPEAGSAERDRAAVAARHLTALARKHLGLAEDCWRSVFDDPAREPNEADLAALQTLERMTLHGLLLGASARRLAETAARLGGPDDLIEPARRTEWDFRSILGRVRAALEAIGHGWKPSDPERYARGVAEAAAGKVVRAEVVLERLRSRTE